MEKFQAVLDLHLKHRSALGYGLVTLLTASGERIFSTTVFQCPCSATWNLSYGLVLGWILIAAVIILLLIFTSVIRCLSPVSFLQLKFWKIYLEQEQQIFKREATEHANKLSKENVKCFFEFSHPKEFKTPSMKDWQQISSVYTFNQKEPYYSMLHKYVNRKDKNDSIRSASGDTSAGWSPRTHQTNQIQIWP